MTNFSKILNGHVVESREITQSDIQRCPHTILVAEHYRKDGSCKCDDRNETVMADWGYVWAGGQWRTKS